MGRLTDDSRTLPRIGAVVFLVMAVLGAFALVNSTDGTTLRVGGLTFLIVGLLAGVTCLGALAAIRSRR